MAEDDEEGLEQYLHIEGERPSTDVLMVISNSAFHLVERVRLAAETFYLGKPRDARLHFVAKHVAIN